MNKDTFLIFVFLLSLVGLVLYKLFINSIKIELNKEEKIKDENESKELSMINHIDEGALDCILYFKDLFYKEQEKSTRLYEFLISLLVAEWGATRLSGLRDNDKMGIMIQTPSGRFFAISTQHELYADLPIDKSWTWDLVLSKQGISTQEQIHQDLKLYANFAIQTKIAEERSFSTENPNT